METTKKGSYASAISDGFKKAQKKDLLSQIGGSICPEKKITICKNPSLYKKTFGIDLHIINEAEALWERDFIGNNKDFNLRRPASFQAVVRLKEMADTLVQEGFNFFQDGISPYLQKLFLVNNPICKKVLFIGNKRVCGVEYLQHYDPKNPLLKNVWLPFIVVDQDVNVEIPYELLPITCSKKGTKVIGLRRFGKPVLFGE